MNENIARVISGAIAAAGPIGNRSMHDWEQQVIASLPLVATMFDDESPVAKRTELFDDAHIYTGLFVNVKVEESSNRAVLRTDAERTDKGEPVFDEIRTDRIDSVLGARIYRMLQRCAPGDKLLMWRVNEPMRDDPKKNVRVLYHVKRLRSAQSSRPTPDPHRQAETPAAAPTGPRSGAARRRNASELTILERYQQLDADGKAAVALACKEKGVKISGSMSGDDEFVLMQAVIAHLQSTGESF